MDFLQKVMNKKKSVLFQTQVKQLKVPCWPELAPSRVWHQAKFLPDFLSYMPDTWGPTSKLLERPFFYGVLVSLAPDFVTALIKDCRDKRRQANNLAKAQKPLAGVDIHPDWLKDLLDEPFTSSK